MMLGRKSRATFVAQRRRPVATFDVVWSCMILGGGMERLRVGAMQYLIRPIKTFEEFRDQVGDLFAHILHDVLVVMEPAACLAAVHADVERIAKQRIDIPTRPGLTDYRCILHAHAEERHCFPTPAPQPRARASRSGRSGKTLPSSRPRTAV